MKKIVILFIAATSIVACKSDDKKVDSPKIKTGVPTPIPENPVPVVAGDTANYTTIQWLDSTYLNLGKHKQGNEIEISYRFKNTGNKNLVIERVTAQCGCTIPEQPQKPFAPGEEGVIKAKYNGSGHDEIRKEVYVKGNIKPDGSDTLVFRAEMTDK